MRLVKIAALHLGLLKDIGNAKKHRTAEEESRGQDGGF